MHKLIIIDDEYEHVQGIKNFIAWEKYDIEVCGVAYNGRDGLELIKKHHPDIALIDIQMPFINGLSLIESVNKLGLNMQMVILSCYDYFEYARKAVELKANSYLLKPCSAEEILKAVLRAKNAVIEEQNRKSVIACYQSFFTKYIDLLKERMLIDLLDNKLRNPSTFFNESSNYNINLPDAACCVAIIRLEGKDSIYKNISNEEFDYLVIRVSEEIKKRKSEAINFELVVKNDDIVLIASNETLNLDELIKFVNRIYEQLQDNFEYPFVIGIGNIVSSPLLSFNSYNQALAALENSLFLGGNKKVTVFDGEMSEENLQYLYPFSEEREIFQCIETCDHTLVNKTVNSFFENFNQEHITNSHFIKKVGIMLLNNILRFCSQKNIDTNELQKLILKGFDDIIESKSLENLNNKIVKIIEDIINHIQNRAPINKFIQKTLNYIHNNYFKDISLKTVADELYISPAYLSFLFKQEMKTNFIDYLNKYRVLMAKELLKDIRLKNYEVAFKVGFQDEKYFYKIFKKYTGLTASQYRDSLTIS